MTQTKDYLEITEEIKEAILNISELQKDGTRKIWLGNCRLDFCKEYYLEGFTKKGVKMFYSNGRDKIKVIGKVYCDSDGTYYRLVTESWSYIQKFYTNKSLSVEMKGLIVQ
jgi:hypothetical protein